MHYYQHNIKDFNNETRHLTRIERSIYRDLIELYFDQEGPLSLDVGSLCRKVVARTEEEKAAVLALLDEFFSQTAEGYRHLSCDEQLRVAVVKIEEAEERRENERERQRRHRERRQSMFAVLRAYGDVPPYDTPTEQLAFMIERYKSQEHTDQSRVTNGVCNEGVTATQYPIPNTHINTITPLPPEGGDPADKSRRKTGAMALPTYLAQCKARGIKPIPDDCAVFEYADKAGISHEFLRLQWFEFRDRYSMEGAKKYKAWPTVFSKSVRANWFKLWYVDANNNYMLTTAGIQASNAHREAA